MSVHSIAEMYAALTRMPVKPRIHPADSMRIVTENILPHLEAVPCSKTEYVDSLKTVANGGWAGAKIYDALILGCARRSSADRIYTFNTSDFVELAPDLSERISAPF